MVYRFGRNRTELFLFAAVLMAFGGTRTSSAQGPNTWTTGSDMPTGVQGPATGVIAGLVYVVGGALQSGTYVNINQIYNPQTNTWTSGQPMPTERFTPVGAVVDNVLYVIGGVLNGTLLSTVEAYDSATNTWSTKSAMPTPRDSLEAVVAGGIIYVIGGYNNTDNRLTTVESYNPSTDTWTEETPLSLGKSLSAAALLGTTIAAAGGLTTSGGVTGDNEGYDLSTNSWQALAPDPTARQAGCSAVISGQLYFAGGTGNSGPVNVNESYNLFENQWTTLVPEPIAQVAPGFASVGNLLYCFGGSNNGVAGQGTVYANVQIYHPGFDAVTVVSSAYSQAIGIAPEMLATAYGTDLASSTPGATTLPLPTTDMGTSIWITDSAGNVWATPLLYVSPGQVNFEVPASVALGTAEVDIASGDGTVSSENVQVNAIAPGVFALDAAGLAAANVLTVSGGTQTYSNVYTVSSSGTLAPDPVNLGGSGDQVYLIVYGTGFQAAGTSGVTVNIDGVNANVSYAGPQGIFAGLDQANVLIPASLAGKGNVTIQLTANGVAANPVNVTIE